MKASDLLTPVQQGAGCLMYEPESQKFFLIQRADTVSSPLSWGLPGGGVDPGEDPKHAAIREMKEEAGIDISSRPLVFLHEIESHSPRFKYTTYGCIVESEIKPTLNWECVDSGWFEIDFLPKNLHPGLEQLFTHDKSAKKLKDFAKQSK